MIEKLSKLEEKITEEVGMEMFIFKMEHDITQEELESVAYSNSYFDDMIIESHNNKKNKLCEVSVNSPPH